MNKYSNKLGLLQDDIKQQTKLERLCADLHAKILTSVGGEISWHYSETDQSAEEALAADWSTWAPFDHRSVWAKKQGHTWFAAEVEVPADAAGKTFVLRFKSQWQDRPGTTDPQCLAYLNGKIAQALDGNHTELVVARNAVAGEKHLLMVNAFTFFERPLVGFNVEHLVRHERAEQLYFDLHTPLEVASRLQQHDARRHAILNLVDKSLRALDRRGGITPEFEASLEAAEAIAAEIYALVDTEIQPTITAVGHTHLDVGWLWRVIHTRDKTGRSFATVISLMEEYPEFIFMYNQSVLFDFLKKDYPELWDRMMERVKSGQFEIEGAMWVEPDVNIISGESLVRQFMRGRRFHMDEFGVTPKMVWLPDTFGYSANLPQIMDRSGLEYFVTSKLSWNDTDRQPFDTFFWRGIDGTKTKAQLITAQEFESEEIFTTYNSMLSVSEVMGAWKRYEPKSVNDEVLVCYGYGDGGGGPTRAMVERGKRMEKGIPGAPKVKLEGVVPYLNRLGKRMDENADRFPIWNGELYLQLHRGTLTSVAKNKANNRRSERLLRETEYLNAIAVATVPDANYPTEKLAEFWDLVLINQFHDILPGTSIEEVYEDSDAEYASIASVVGSHNGPWHSAATAISKPQHDELTLFNFTGHTRQEELVTFAGEVPEGAGLSSNGKATAIQKLVTANGDPAFGAMTAAVPSLGWASAKIVARKDDKPTTNLSVSEKHLENAHIRVSFDTAGEIISIIDKAHNREVIEPGKAANQLIAYEDKPKNWDAWDIDSYFEEQYWPLSDGPVKIEIVETGPHRAALRIERGYAASKIVQIISLRKNARQIEFDTQVDWQERQTVLKALFPFDLNVSEIRSEIQFGHVSRATHRNTSWDRARYEASMHRWVDMSEANFGVSLLNDCKYGYDAVEQMIRITLLRSSISPNPKADLGLHEFKYALFVHEGVSDLAEVHQAAERFNNPIAVIGDTQILAAEPEKAARTFSFASVDQSNVTLETVKKAEDSDDLILRVFEHANRRVTANIQFGLPVKSVQTVNLMEEGGEPVELKDGAVTLELNPFEITTLRITIA